MKTLVIIGTRPEAIKMAPVILALQSHGVDVALCVTGQHREMMSQVLDIFKLKPTFNLDIMKPNQSLSYISSAIMHGLDSILEGNIYDWALVQGDTLSAFIGALTAFYYKIPVAHIEAGLRTDNIYDPFPEEMSRRLITQLATVHFAPTRLARENLKKAGVVKTKIFTTGNTVIDSLKWVLNNRKDLIDVNLDSIVSADYRTILLTAHRRENIGERLDGIFQAINTITQKHADVHVIYPVHPNPKVLEQAHKHFAGNPNVHCIAPLAYPDLANIISKCYLVVTDSGGLQEEAPTYGKPVVVVRETTERPEGVDAGTAILAGTPKEKIVAILNRLLTDSNAYARMAKAINPYGDGYASERIVTALKNELKISR